MYFKQRWLSSAVIASCVGVSMSSLAAIEEIVVTARKSAENLQSTPVAVTALNEQMLINAQVTEIADLKRTAPNLSILPGGTGSSALIFVAIRGQAQVSPGGGADPSVGTYIDGVYYARPTGGNVAMFDVAQAEILRGPQGTLFGRNTTGGALSIKTNDPTGEWEGHVKAGVGNYGSVQYQGVFNIPIIGDELAARFSYRSTEHDGYGSYRAYNDPNGFSFAGLNQEAQAVDKNLFGRAKLRWAPADQNFVATLSADWSEFRDTGQRTEVKTINPADFATFWLGMIGFDGNAFLKQQKFGDAQWNTDSSSLNPDVYNDGRMNNPKSTANNSGVYLDLDFDLGDFQFKSITAYREASSLGTVDLDGLPVNILTFSSRWEQEQFSQEFQLTGSWGDKLDWVSGLYYFQENSDDFAVSRFSGDSALIDLGAGNQIGVPLELVQNPFVPAPAPFNQIHGAGTNDATFDASSFGAFVQANYQFTDALRGTFGVRYTKDSKDVVIKGESLETGQIGAIPPDNCKAAPSQRDNPAICANTEKANFEYPAWVLGLDYQINDDLFVYAKTSGASMAGGWNFRSTGLPSFEPENVKDIEVGFKSDLLDGNLRLNGAFFYSKSDDLQRTVNTFDVANNTTTQFIINAGKSHSYGAEFELTWVPWEGMTVDANLAFLESEYDEFDDGANVPDPDNPGQTMFVTVDRTGEALPQAPEMTWSLGATQILETGLGELSLHADYSWVDKTWFQDNTVNPLADAATQALQTDEKRWNAIPSYGLLNARAILRTDDGSWEFSLWGRNLADEEYYTGVANFYNGVGTANWYYGNPRTYGGSVQYNW